MTPTVVQTTVLHLRGLWELSKKLLPFWWWHCQWRGPTAKGQLTPRVRSFTPQLLRKEDHCIPPLQTRPLMQGGMQGLEGQRGRKPKFIGTWEVPVPKGVFTLNFHQPLPVPVRRSMDTLAVAGWSYWGGDGRAQGLDLSLRRFQGRELWNPKLLSRDTCWGGATEGAPRLLGRTGFPRQAPLQVAQTTQPKPYWISRAL